MLTAIAQWSEHHSNNLKLGPRGLKSQHPVFFSKFITMKPRTPQAIANRLRKKYKLNNNFKGNISPLLKNHQNILAVFLLGYEHPIARATRAAVKKEINKKSKAKKTNQNNELVPIKVPGGGKATMWTMGRRKNHFD